MPRQLTLSDYTGLAKRRGFTLIGKNKRRNSIPTEWQCKYGHRWKACYASIRVGRGCPYCAGKRISDISILIDIGNEHGFIWSGKRMPIKPGEKTKWKCKNGHIFIRTASAIRGKYGCYICVRESHKAPSNYRQIAREKKLIWLGPSVNKVTDKTKWECKRCGRIIKKSYNVVRGEKFGCPVCAKNLPKTETDFIRLAKQRNIIYLGPFPGNTLTYTRWKCKQGHIWETSYGNIRAGHGCRLCSIDARSGPNSSSWAGGKINYGKGWNRKTKLAILGRDEWLCQLGGISSAKLDVHHIVPARIAPSEWKHSPENLIVLSPQKHVWADRNLAQSIPLLRKLLRKKFGYTYKDKENYDLSSLGNDNWYTNI